MSIADWLDRQHISELELASMLGVDRSRYVLLEPKNQFLVFDGTNTAYIRPPQGWVWEIISVMIYAGTAPAADLWGSIDITQPNVVPGGAISNFYYETPLITAAAGGDIAWNIVPVAAHYATVADLNVVTTPMPYRYVYGGWTMSISLPTSTWREGMVLYRTWEIEK